MDQSLRPSQQRLLKIINLSAFSLHTLLFILVFWYFIKYDKNNTEKKLFGKKIYRPKPNLWKFNFALSNPKNEDITINLGDNPCIYLPDVKADIRKKAPAKVDIVLLILLFTGVTAFAHLLYGGLINRYYNKEIKRGRNLIRWVEYGITATIMAVILAVVGGVRHYQSIVLIAVTTVVQMLQGSIVEREVSAGNSILSPSVFVPLICGWGLFSGAWYVIIEQWYDGLNESMKTYEPCNDIYKLDVLQYKAFRAKLTEKFPNEFPAQNTSIDSFYNTIKNDPVLLNEFNKFTAEFTEDIKDGEDRTTGPPKFLQHLIWIVFAFYVSFGVVNLAHAISRTVKPNINFVGFETAYIALSFVSKTLLVVWCFLTVLQNVEWLTTCPYGSTDCKPIKAVRFEENSTTQE